MVHTYFIKNKRFWSILRSDPGLHILVINKFLVFVMKYSSVINKFLVPLPGTDLVLGGSTRSLTHTDLITFLVNQVFGAFVGD